MIMGGAASASTSTSTSTTTGSVGPVGSRRPIARQILDENYSPVHTLAPPPRNSSIGSPTSGSRSSSMAEGPLAPRWGPPNLRSMTIPQARNGSVTPGRHRRCRADWSGARIRSDGRRTVLSGRGIAGLREWMSEPKPVRSAPRWPVTGPRSPSSVGRCATLPNRSVSMGPTTDPNCRVEFLRGSCARGSAPLPPPRCARGDEAWERGHRGRADRHGLLRVSRRGVDRSARRRAAAPPLDGYRLEVNVSDVGVFACFPGSGTAIMSVDIGDRRLVVSESGDDRPAIVVDGPSIALRPAAFSSGPEQWWRIDEGTSRTSIDRVVGPVVAQLGLNSMGDQPTRSVERLVADADEVDRRGTGKYRIIDRNSDPTVATSLWTNTGTSHGSRCRPRIPGDRAVPMTHRPPTLRVMRTERPSRNRPTLRPCEQLTGRTWTNSTIDRELAASPWARDHRSRSGSFLGVGGTIRHVHRTAVRSIVGTGAMAPGQTS